MSIDDIRARWQAATPGPFKVEADTAYEHGEELFGDWLVLTGDREPGLRGLSMRLETSFDGGNQQAAEARDRSDIEFYSRARNDVGRLLDEVARLRAVERRQATKLRDARRRLSDLAQALSDLAQSPPPTAKERRSPQRATR